MRVFFFLTVKPQKGYVDWKLSIDTGIGVVNGGHFNLG